MMCDILCSLCEELRHFGVFEELEEKIDSLLACNSFDSLYDKILTRLEEQQPELRQQLRDMLCLLYVSRQGLQEHELCAIVSLGADGFWHLFVQFKAFLVDRNSYLQAIRIFLCVVFFYVYYTLIFAVQRDAT